MYQRILVPVDGSATSNRGLAEAIALGRLTGGSLRLIHVIDELNLALGAEGFGGIPVDLLAQFRERGTKILATAKSQVLAAGLEAEVALRDNTSGRVCDLVVEEARHWKADLIVIGTHGRRGVGRMVMGSDAEQILRLSTVPVLLVRSDAAAPA